MDTPLLNLWDYTTIAPHFQQNPCKSRFFDGERTITGSGDTKWDKGTVLLSHFLLTTRLNCDKVR